MLAITDVLGHGQAILEIVHAPLEWLGSCGENPFAPLRPGEFIADFFAPSHLAM